MTDRPNIVLFLTDDHGAWANGCNGNQEVETPNLDCLAAEGVRFSNTFTPSPVCSPARACLMTGRTPSQVGIHDWLQEKDEQISDHDWLADEITLPALLAEAGYYCGLSGKWHLGLSHVTPRGFDWYFGLPYWQGVHNGRYSYVYNNQMLTLEGNKSQLITDYALRFLETLPDEQPFFLKVGYVATHSPYESESHVPELVRRYDESTFCDIPPYTPHPWHSNEGLADGFNPTPEELRSRYQGYYAAVHEIDTQIGRIVEKLAQMGQLDNTIILYTSDHGCALGHHGFWGKGNSTRPFNMYETSLRVPLIIRGTEHVGQGQTIERCVDHYDTFQTICDWAGIDVKQEQLRQRAYPGSSYAALARGEEIPAWRDTRYGEYGDLRMIRTPTHKFVKRYPHGPHDLFDLVNDPDETLNRAAWLDDLPTQQQLEAELEGWYVKHEESSKSGLKVKQLKKHNDYEAWRDGLRELRGLQVYTVNSEQ